MTRNSIISCKTKNNVLTITVADAGNLTVDISKLDQSIIDEAVIHGLKQKISDAAALGKDATSEDKYAAMECVVNRLVKDKAWNKQRGDGSSPVSGLIFRALYQFLCDTAKAAKKPMPSEETVRKLYDSKTRSEQLDLRNIPEVAAIMDQLRASKSPKVDTVALLAEIGI